MACLLALPCELSLQIFKLLPIGDKTNLSATCKLYRAQLLPEIIFNTIRFTNDETSATSALIAVEAHGQYVKAIEFTCQCDLDDRPTAPSLLPAACEVLKGHSTPNLQMVRLKSDLDLDNDDTEVHIYFENEENADATRAEEQRDKWRALMNETWEALAANTFVRELILDELPPKCTSTYYTNAFRQFLSQLESATFIIFGMEDYMGIRTNTMRGCWEFLCSLDALFFRHMRGLKHLHIQASDPLGIDSGSGPPYISLALKPEDLPLLQSLKLENCFICPELASFIQAHAQVLKYLDINECFSGCTSGRYSTGYLSWAELFDGIYKSKPRLTELIAGGNKAPFTRDFTNDLTEDAVEHTRQRLEADPTLKVFRHIFLDADEGILCVDEEANLERFSQGDDQRAYNRLIRLVNENRA